MENYVHLIYRMSEFMEKFEFIKCNIKKIQWKIVYIRGTNS